MTSQWKILFSILASQRALWDRDQLRQLGHELENKPDLSLPDFAVDVGWLTPSQREEIVREIENLLKKDPDHDPPSTEKDEADSSVVDSTKQEFQPLPPPPQKPKENVRIRDLFQKSGVKTETTQAANHYQRLRIHAQGGIGRIWVAQDQRLKREVALKELRPDTAGSLGTRQRFHREARITGQLEHPSIVPIYELSGNEDNQAPFYVMRFLKGKTLNEAIDEYHQKKTKGQATRLDRSNLLQAFVSVCNAVGYAHSRGVIHRDLKGSNILLGDFGQVIVLDWGLAKRVTEGKETDEASQSRLPDQSKPSLSPMKEADSSEDNADELTEIEIDSLCFSKQTRQGAVMGTLAYMAPEQAAGDVSRIDHRTDVYGLGAILYEMLTSRPPFSLIRSKDKSDQQAVSEMLERIQTESPATPRELAKDVPASLEAICLRAMAREPKGRYSSAIEMAEDLKRWLADEPISVYPDPIIVRVTRWARRHRTLVTSILLVLFVGLIALGMSNVLLGQEKARTAEAAARARKNFAQAREAVDKFYIQVSENRLLNEPGLQPLRRELLLTAHDYYESFLQEQKNIPGMRMELVQTLFKLSGVTRDLGDPLAALKPLDQALQLLDAEERKSHLDSEKRLLFARIQARKGQCFHILGKEPDAISNFTAALKTLDRISSTENNEAIQFKGDYVGNLGLIYLKKAKEADGSKQKTWLKKAEKALIQSLALHQELAQANPSEDTFLDDVAASHTNLSQLLSRTNLSGAKHHLHQALKIHKKLVAEHPRSLEYQNHLGKSYNNLGVLYSMELDFHAEKLLTSALEIREKLARENPNITSFRQELGDVHLNLGNYYYRIRSSAEAKKKPSLTEKANLHYEQALDSYHRLHQEFPENRKFAIQVGIAHSSLGNVWYDTDLDQALLWYGRAVKVLQPLATTKPVPWEIAKPLGTSHWGRAELFARKEEWEKALNSWAATAAFRKSFDEAAWKQISSGITRTLHRAQKSGFLKKPAGIKAVERLQTIPDLRDHPALSKSGSE